MQRLQHAAHRHAANLLDFSAPQWLPIRDERQRLEGGGTESRWPRRQLRPLDRFGVLGPREDLPTAADLDQLDAMPVDIIVLAQLVERGGNRRFRRLGIERGEFVGRDGASAGEQRRFKQLR